MKILCTATEAKKSLSPQNPIAVSSAKANRFSTVLPFYDKKSFELVLLVVVFKKGPKKSHYKSDFRHFELFSKETSQ